MVQSSAEEASSSFSRPETRLDHVSSVHTGPGSNNQRQDDFQENTAPPSQSFREARASFISEEEADTPSFLLDYSRVDSL
jgi:hypothetical protein